MKIEKISEEADIQENGLKELSPYLLNTLLKDHINVDKKADSISMFLR